MQIPLCPSQIQMVKSTLLPLGVLKHQLDRGQLSSLTCQCSHHLRKWTLLFPCSTVNPKGVKARNAGLPETSWKAQTATLSHTTGSYLLKWHRLPIFAAMGWQTHFSSYIKLTPHEMAKQKHVFASKYTLAELSGRAPCSPPCTGEGRRHTSPTSEPSGGNWAPMFLESDLWEERAQLSSFFPTINTKIIRMATMRR